MMDNKTFKAIRMAAGFTQLELATIFGYAHKIRVSEFERSTNAVPIPPHIERAMLNLLKARSEYDDQRFLGDVVLADPVIRRYRVPHHV